MGGAFLDASFLRNQRTEEATKFDVQQNKILFEFPLGFNQLRLIEECRALNALDVSEEDNFDLMYDILMQSISGKPVFIYFVDDAEKKTEIGKFVANDRYMNLRSVDIIDEYPILVNWMVEFFSGMLGKKYPRSLNSIQAKMNGREEHTKSLLKKKK